jgi:endonuclease YncB( thermonuclease family)
MNRSVLGIVLLLFAPVAAPADELVQTCQHDAATFRCVKYVRNYDGDTVTVEIPGVHPLLGKGISVRVFGIDTPEKNGKKPCEKQRARDAQRIVASLLKNAKSIELRKVDRDKYFRILAEIWADGKSVGDVLLKNGLAYPYDGGTKPTTISWCPKPGDASPSAHRPASSVSP